MVVGLLEREGLTPEEANTLGWLIALSDRVGAQDIG